VVSNAILAEPALIGVRRVALGLLDDFDDAWRELVATQSGERKQNDSRESLHDFRVTLRTLRSWLRANDGLLSIPKTIRRRLKRIAATTGPGRDAEVLNERLLSLDNLPRRGVDAAKLWSDALVRRAGDAHLLARLADDVNKASTRLRKELRTIRWVGGVDDDPWWQHSLACELAAQISRQRAVLAANFDGFRSSFAPGSHVLDDKASRSGHRLRIEGKRVRYLIEPIRSELETAGPALKSLKDLQAVLGDLHDLHVALADLEDFTRQRITIEAEQRSHTRAAAPVRTTTAANNPWLSGFASIASAIRQQEHRCLKDCERILTPEARRELFSHIDDCIAKLHDIGATGGVAIVPVGG
jgi:CHAD domain-containing protein